MHADTFFAGCRAHKVCQDYSRASNLIPNRSYAIVSDGCSSSPDTDFGARFLTLAAARDLFRSPNFYPEDIITKAATFLIPPLVPECLDATLLIARETPEGVDVHVAGDGFVIARTRNLPDRQVPGCSHLLTYEFDFRGAPAYLSYLLDSGRRETYLKEGYGVRTIRAWSLWQDREPSLLSLHSDNPFTGEADYPSGHLGGMGPFFTHTFPRETYDLVVICTDGAGAFQHKETFEPVSFGKVLYHLTAFPSFTGEFVTRRVRKFLTKECTELGWVQNDDLAVGAIYLGDTP